VAFGKKLRFRISIRCVFVVLVIAKSCFLGWLREFVCNTIRQSGFDSR
jgi:hypothetical protein